MNDFVPRLIGKPEAIRLGIQDGWYGIKVSGTFVTERCESLAVCKAAIDLIPVQAEVEFAWASSEAACCDALSQNNRRRSASSTSNQSSTSPVIVHSFLRVFPMIWLA